jgi:hypothetical protein
MRIVYTFLNVLITLLFLNTFGFAQNKQGNTTGADIFADAPYRMKKYNAQGLLQPIPIHLFVHDADGLGFNVDLINIDIKIKNARDSVFNNVITFNNLSASEFDSLLIHRSPNDNDLDIQKFDDSDYEKSSDHTIIFTAYHDVLDNEDYVKIDSKFWYFTLLIPPDKLQGFEDIIDIHIYFNIDWSTDDNTSSKSVLYLYLSSGEAFSQLGFGFLFAASVVSSCMSRLFKMQKIGLWSDILSS